MKKIFSIVLIAFCLLACGGCKKEGEAVEDVPKRTVTTLEGTKWGGSEEGTDPQRNYYEATIQNGIIEITFVNKRSHRDPIVWWYGPYTDPENETDSFSWVCYRDSEKISPDAHYGGPGFRSDKTIYYSDGKLYFLYNDVYGHDEADNPWIILEQIEDNEGK